MLLSSVATTRYLNAAHVLNGHMMSLARRNLSFEVSTAEQLYGGGDDYRNGQQRSAVDCVLRG